VEGWEVEENDGGPTHVRDEWEYRGDNVFSPLPWFTVHFSNDNLNETEGVPSYLEMFLTTC
jgi:hypothetical protein